MKFLTQMRIAPRLALAFGTVLLAAAAVVLFSISRLGIVTESLTLIGEDRVPKVQKLVDIADHMSLTARELRKALIFDEPAKLTTSMAIAAQARDDVVTVLEDLTYMITSDEGKRRLAVINKARQAYAPLEMQFIELVRAGNRDEAKVMLTERMQAAERACFKAVTDLKQYQIALIHRAVERAHDDLASDKALMLSLLAVMLVLSGAFAWLIAHSIVKPLQSALASTERIANGDLREVLRVQGHDETADLLHAMGRMRDSLRSLVGQVRTGVDSVNTASTQIAAGNMDLSQRTEEQASSLQQTAASMEQLTGTVTQSADNALRAKALAQAASSAASKGGDMVNQVVSTMEHISTSSQRIGEIISTIDGIAFQTNILALNAAVEAARAGEQGHGFAVVAEEVRTLAQHSAQAAKEIKSLIADSTEKVLTGGQQVAQAGAAMDDIVNQVRRVTDLVAEMSTAVMEQRTGIGQVNQAVAQMDQVTQQNAALVEESAAAAQSLSAQAQRLADVVAKFRVDADANADVNADAKHQQTAAEAVLH